MNYLTYEIESSPPPAPPRVYLRKYPWQKLEVGQAFFIECLPMRQKESYERVQKAAWKWAQANSVKRRYQIYAGTKEGMTGLWVKRIV